VLDVLTFGEVMVRLAAPLGESLESASRFVVHVAGAEANVAVTLARMGFASGWISKLPDMPLGRRIAAELRRHGVDVSAVIWTAEGRAGLYFVEHAPPPRGVTVHYDRAGSAFSTITPDEIDWTYARSAKWLHLTGITPALSEACAQASARLAREAKAAGTRLSFDVNFRRKLWTAERAQTVLDPLVQGADILIAAQEDARDVFRLEGEPPDLAVNLRGRCRAAAVVVTAGAAGAYLADATGVHYEAAVSGGEVDPIGRGDAFAAGVLWGALEGNLAAGLRYGAALAALSQTYWGDVLWSTRRDVLAVFAGRGSKPER
jgi:2-dehydro-3-deoxygluconokinase